jgi:hypothetical protein
MKVRKSADLVREYNHLEWKIVTFAEFAALPDVGAEIADGSSGRRRFPAEQSRNFVATPN